MTALESDVLNGEALKYVFTHVFCPLQLPDGDDHSPTNDRSLSLEVYHSASAYAQHVDTSATPQWKCIVEMLRNIFETTRIGELDETLIVSQIQAMHVGDVVVYYIRAQNAAVIFRKETEKTLVESFEVSPSTAQVMGARGKLLCSYPGPAIAVPNEIFNDAVFRSELANFLAAMNKDILDATPTTTKAGSEVNEPRDTAHPRYITELLTGILRGIGSPIDVKRISKRIGDDVVWKDSLLPWRRSPLWLIIRVAMQTTLERNGLGRDVYKTFMLFFMNRLAQNLVQWDMSNDDLQYASAKISQRLTKMGSSSPEWLSEMVLETCKGIRNLLDQRWEAVQKSDAASPPWDPSTLDFSADTQLSLLHSKDYITGALNRNLSSERLNFQLEGRLRGKLNDFLSVNGEFFDKAYRAEPYLTLYDVEKEVGQGIDDWVDCV
ncbi:hypothetical protein ID866_4005, partial [Astraeus odoratus]